MARPKIGNRYKHKNGNIYKVLMLANEDALAINRKDYPVVVVYQGENGRIWSRTLDNWERSFTEVESN